MFPTYALAVEGARNRMSTSDKVFSFTLSTARYKALPQPCAGTLDAPRICASITTSRSPLCLACRPSLDRSGELYTFDPKSNINQFPGCRKVRANCKCAFIVHSNRRTRCRCSVQYKRHSIHVRLTFDSCFGLWVSTIVQTSTARTSNAPKTTT